MSPTPAKRVSFFRFLVLTMAVTGVVATTIAFLDDWHWGADLFAQVRPQYLVWLALTALGAVAMKHRSALVLSVVGMLANVIILIPYALPWHDDAGAKPLGRTWSFATVNLLYGNQEVSKVVGYLRKVQVDVVVFQEVSARWESELEALSDLYPYRSTQPRKDSFGVAIFSREKPLDVTIRSVGNRPGDFAIFARFESEGQRYGLVSVHPDKPDNEWKTVNRRIYLGNVAQWCETQAAAGIPVVAIGDFNATPWSSSMRRFTRETKLRNTNQGSIFGATWNVWEPHRLLIDHVFLSSHWTLLDRDIGPNVGSDHRPLVVRAALRAE